MLSVIGGAWQNDSWIMLTVCSSIDLLVHTDLAG